MAERKFEIFKIGLKIELARTEKGLNQEELAKKIKVQRQTIGRWENGETLPDNIDLQNIAAATGKPLSFFLPGEVQVPPGITPEILEALQDPIAVKALLVTYKNKQDIKSTIKTLLETLPSLSPEKRQAIIALCR